MTMMGLCEDEHCTERKKVNSMYKFSSDVLYGVYILSQHEPWKIKVDYKY